jgi:hypothetical protein
MYWSRTQRLAPLLKKLVQRLHCLLRLRLVANQGDVDLAAGKEQHIGR